MLVLDMWVDILGDHGFGVIGITSHELEDISMYIGSVAPPNFPLVEQFYEGVEGS